MAASSASNIRSLLMQSGDYSDDERIDNEGSVVDDNDVEIIDGDSTVNSDNKSTPTTLITVVRRLATDKNTSKKKETANAGSK